MLKVECKELYTKQKPQGQTSDATSVQKLKRV
jgi:hypothetical protein